MWVEGLDTSKLKYFLSFCNHVFYMSNFLTVLLREVFRNPITQWKVYGVSVFAKIVNDFLAVQYFYEKAAS